MSLHDRLTPRAIALGHLVNLFATHRELPLGSRQELAFILIEQVSGSGGADSVIEQGLHQLRAALVATYWRGGDAAKAEDTWLDLCQIDDAQCGKYGDKGWLLSYRKWTPGLADAMQDFLKLRS